jgi:hypothetical protein
VGRAYARCYSDPHLQSNPYTCSYRYAYFNSCAYSDANANLGARGYLNSDPETDRNCDRGPHPHLYPYFSTCANCNPHAGAH